MRKTIMARVIAFVMCLTMVLSLFEVTAFAKEESQDLNIYAMYLNTTAKGESVLLESDGEYLLMDLGMYPCVDAVVDQLKKLKVKKINLYFSHFHGDHNGAKTNDMLAGMKKLTKAGIKIKTLYVPDKSVMPKSKDYAKKYKKYKTYVTQKGGKVKKLKVGSSITFGDATVDIIGPVSVDTYKPSDFKDREDSGDGGGGDVATTYYENNCSLIAKVTCGKTTYLTCGDIMEEQADLLVKEYGKKLHADILKVSHHGTGSGTNNKFIKAVSPQYAFAQNTGFTGKDKKTKQRITFITQEMVTKSAMLYMTGSQKKTVIYNIKDNVIKLYEKSIKPANLITGWKKLVGGDGVNRTFDKYYFDENGKLMTGVQKIDGNYFFLGDSGCMEYGAFDEKGNYSGWKDGKKERRYFELTDDGEFSIMATGFKKIDGKRYYFKPSTGYRVTSGRKTKKLVKIGKYQYGVGSTGVLITNTWATIEGTRYYFDKKSRLVKDAIVEIGGKYYYFDDEGKLVKNTKKKQIIEVDGKKYGLGKTGAFIVDTWATIDGAKYIFDETGCMITHKIIKKGGKFYYFGKDGKMVRGKQILKIGKKKYGIANGGAFMTKTFTSIGADKYYFNSKGVMVTEQKVNIDGNERYFGADGTMQKDVLVEIDGKKYYFNIYGSLVKDGYVRVDGVKYYCDENGVATVS